jgi:transposase-like protein
MVEADRSVPFGIAIGRGSRFRPTFPEISRRIIGNLSVGEPSRQMTPMRFRPLTAGLIHPAATMPAVENFSIVSLGVQIATEADAYKYLEEVRWGDETACPHCGVISSHYFLTPKNGISRETSSGKQSQRRMWKCSACRKTFSVTTKTVMHGSHVPLRTWLFVFFELVANENGIAADEISRRYSITCRTAWHLTQRIREAMAAGPLVEMVGTSMANERWIGGAPKNMRADKCDPESRQGLTGGTPIVSLVHKETWSVPSAVKRKSKYKEPRSIYRDGVTFKDALRELMQIPVQPRPKRCTQPELAPPGQDLCQR